MGITAKRSDILQGDFCRVFCDKPLYRATCSKDGTILVRVSKTGQNSLVFQEGVEELWYRIWPVGFAQFFHTFLPLNYRLSCFVVFLWEQQLQWAARSMKSVTCALTNAYWLTLGNEAGNPHLGAARAAIPSSPEHPSRQGWIHPERNDGQFCAYLSERWGCLRLEAQPAWPGPAWRDGTASTELSGAGSTLLRSRVVIHSAHRTRQAGKHLRHFTGWVLLIAV